jgi:hypothetical protein
MASLSCQCLADQLFLGKDTINPREMGKLIGVHDRIRLLACSTADALHNKMILMRF